MQRLLFSMILCCQKKVLVISVCKPEISYKYYAMRQDTLIGIFDQIYIDPRYI